MSLTFDFWGWWMSTHPTKADRVILVNPSWNPCTDNQFVDRAYRIGQTKDVIVYRLITCGTIEEKTYIKQVLKEGLFRITENKRRPRYFNTEGKVVYLATYSFMANSSPKDVGKYEAILDYMFLDENSLPTSFNSSTHVQISCVSRLTNCLICKKKVSFFPSRNTYMKLNFH
ncbi:protein CHROMATIN REMODELING 24-like isoform X1 [Primulina eburnea]|uniref:protein CHROMATIN REMODELING 24-like isoform X1 n=1 Tax=Primulina eburnea TaxID=1245227 RepID=UPI003C6BE61D